MTRKESGAFTRRRVLAGSAALAAAPFPARAAAPVISPLTTTLAAYMAAAANRALPEAVAEKTKQMILDTIAAMVSGSELPPGKFATGFARAYGGEKVATVAASDIVCGPIEAAMVNGMLAHSDETDDTHPVSFTHPGCSVVPSALAAGEKFGTDGPRLMRSVALGYDVGTRVTATLGRVRYAVESHLSTHGICGTFGSAAAAACSAGLNAEQMRWLLSYTAQEASGLYAWQRDTQHVEKSFDFGGMPARNGISAALLVQAGGTGVDDVFAGADNFFQAFVPMNDPGMLVDGLGMRYEISRTNVKKWTVGSPIQAPLDAIDILLKANRFAADDVKQVVVRVATDEAANVNNREIPDICLQHMVAVMLIDKTASFRAAHDVERMKDPTVLRTRAKVRLTPDMGLQMLLPNRVAIVEVTLNDGQMLTQRVDAVKGTVENPMTRGEVIAKARDLCVPVLGADKFQKLSDTIFALENVRNIVELRPLLQKA
jgi:2-methylcitrate dehydratase PrpD